MVVLCGSCCWGCKCTRCALAPPQGLLRVDLCRQLPRPIHCRLVCPNFYARTSTSASPQLADFGFSKDANQHSAPNSRVGTPAYLAPEVVKLQLGQKYDGQVRTHGVRAVNAAAAEWCGMHCGAPCPYTHLPALSGWPASQLLGFPHSLTCCSRCFRHLPGCSNTSAGRTPPTASSLAACPTTSTTSRSGCAAQAVRPAPACLLGA